MRVVGIDVGKTGAIAVIGPNGAYSVVDMPTFKVKKGKSVKTRLDKFELFKILKQINEDYPISFCAIERQIPFPKEGVVSSFSLGEQIGLIEGMLLGLNIPFEEVLPQRWRKEFNLARGKSTKHVAYETASGLFPLAQLRTPRGRLLDGRSDSLLLAEFARRTKSKQEVI